MLPNSRNNGSSTRQGDSDAKKQQSQSEKTQWDVGKKVNDALNQPNKK